MIMLLILAVLASPDPTRGVRVEGIAAIVGGELILHSDVDGLVAFELQQRQLSAPDESTTARIREEVLQQLIDDRLLLNYARQETIDVPSDQVEESLQDRIRQIRARFPSESSFMAQLEAEGLDMPRFRELQRRIVQEQLMKAKLQERLRAQWRIQVSEAEVRRFCEERRDEIPDTPERVELAHILLKPGAPLHVRAAQDSLLRSLRSRLVAGESFADLARQYSEDASASLGGDLGFFPRGTMVAEFERALERLNPGEVSEVVETRFGLHLIQLVERNEQGFHARHIIRLLPPDTDNEAVERLVHEITAKSETTPFEELVVTYSSDEDTKAKGGILGIVVPSTLPQTPLRAVLDTLPEHRLSPPVTDAAGIHLYWIVRRLPGGKPPCEEIASGIRDLLLSEKLQARLDSFLQELRAETYIEVFE